MEHPIGTDESRTRRDGRRHRPPLVDKSMVSEDRERDRDDERDET